MTLRSFIKRGALALAATGLLLTSSFSQTWSGDTLRLNAISFEDPSPVGWNAQYKTVVNFPDDDTEWSQIIMVQIESTIGDTLVTFPPDFGQELLLNFIVE
ncbi:MAG: hypothetical protein HON27_08295 [Candidatus Marinimicrobia bacterium]|jgi:hypothetical protein|nr:hypothetical protein [Candidatus Neomarinimicrobiota bacterium]MBT4361791.1 hypothetical protein [Candidatus Neomarinimicrobiota bacterium]MBT4946154.1 hypothetical protein [Candidatus Neomarinimicrobiota bacterium]MBT7669402.1 hypothetical protein [Bdellovibrionales bacterium]